MRAYAVQLEMLTNYSLYHHNSYTYHNISMPQLHQRLTAIFQRNLGYPIAPYISSAAGTHPSFFS